MGGLWDNLIACRDKIGKQKGIFMRGIFNFCGQIWDEKRFKFLGKSMFGQGFVCE